MPKKSQKTLRWAYLPECDEPPPNWRLTHFNNVADVIAGQSPPSETYNGNQVGLPFLQGNAEFGHLNPTPNIWCSAPKKIASKNDILISVRAPVGEINIAERNYAIGRGLAALRAKDLEQNFLYHAIQRWRWSLQRVSQGTTFDAVTARHFKQLYVVAPPTEEQKAIARILDSVDRAIERTREAIDSANLLQKSLLQNFLFEALGETAYADRPKKKLPSGWKLIPTGELLHSDPKNGKSPTTNSQPPGIPTFSIAAIRNGHVDLGDLTHRKYAQISEKEAEPYLVSKGDVLIVRGNANPELVGKAGIIQNHPPGCIYPDITKRVIFKTTGEFTVSPEYAAMIWNHSVVHNQILRRAKTSNGTLKINTRDVKQIVLPVAPKNEQKKITRLIQATQQKVLALNGIQNAYEILKISLMHDLLTGKVRTIPVKSKAPSENRS